MLSANAGPLLRASFGRDGSFRNVSRPTDPPGSPAAVTLQYPGDVSTLGSARRDVLSWLQTCGADDESRERAALIISELATNALQAAPGNDYQVQLTRLDGERAAITVHNASNGTYPPPPEQWRPVDRSALRGRGLAIVKTLSEEVTVRGDDDQVSVTATIKLRD